MQHKAASATEASASRANLGTQRNSLGCQHEKLRRVEGSMATRRTGLALKVLTVRINHLLLF